MSMLQAVLTQIAQRPEKGEVLSFVPEISSCFVQIINDSCDADSSASLSSNHMKDTIKFVLQAARISSRIEPAANDKLQSAWKVVKLQDAVEKLQSSERFKASTSIHDLMKQLIKVLQPDAAGSGDGKKKAARTTRSVPRRSPMPYLRRRTASLHHQRRRSRLAQSDERNRLSCFQMELLSLIEARRSVTRAE